MRLVDGYLATYPEKKFSREKTLLYRSISLFEGFVLHNRIFIQTISKEIIVRPMMKVTVAMTMLTCKNSSLPFNFSLLIISLSLPCENDFPVCPRLKAMIPLI